MTVWRDRPDTAAYRATSRLSWGGNFTGTFVTLAVGFTLLSLGAALGLSTIDPATADMSAVGWGTGIWSILTVIVATFVGAYVGVKASRLRANRDGALQGFTIWALSFLTLTFFTGLIAAAGAAAAATAEQAAPGEALGMAATWGYFITAVLGAVSGVLGGMAAFPTEEKREERVERRRRTREPELRPSEA